MIAALGGIDLLVFTGGIGENDADARFAICDDLSWAGIILDAERNRQAANPITASHSPCGVLVLHSQEEKQIARHAWTVLSARLGP
jgi:acetate kinase